MSCSNDAIIAAEYVANESGIKPSQLCTGALASDGYDRGSFDYKVAWTVLAHPSYAALPQEVKDLVNQVAEEASDMHQNRDLGMDWPDTDLKAKFEAMDTKTLARASRIVHNHGHWAWGENREGSNQENGVSWKFSLYADQVLRERLELPRKIAPSDVGLRNKNSHLQLDLHQGMVRLQVDFSHSWQWEEIGWADDWSMPPKSPRMVGRSRQDNDKFSDFYMGWATNQAKEKADAGSHAEGLWFASRAFVPPYNQKPRQAISRV